MRGQRYGLAPPLLATLTLAACGHPTVREVEASSVATAAPPPAASRVVRATGTIAAVRQFSVLTPSIAGQASRLTLTSLVANGSKVSAGDVLAEFDTTTQLEAAREARAKFDDFGHQAAQRAAQNRADAEKRTSELRQAEADLAKALLQLRRGPTLSEIDRLKNDVKAEDARARVESLKKSMQARARADAAALRILELKRDRQKVALERSENNLGKLVVKAPLAGMVALENTFRGGSMGHAQEGDQLYPGQPLLRIFDPSEMEVRTFVGEPDGAVLVPGARAMVRLDAYPEIVLRAHFISASPVAVSALGSPIKRFAARFRLESGDAHLLPDLSAAVIIGAEGSQTLEGSQP